MVLIGKGRLGPDIWSKTPQQAESIENIIRITWNTKAIQQQKARGKPDYPLAPTGKETRYMRALLFCD